MARSTDPAPATVRAVRERDDWRCARCAGWGPLSTQHRIARGMGGSRWPGINLPANLLTVCGSGTTQCHGWIEHHPAYARLHGYAVARNIAGAHHPADVPVWTWRGWVLLDDDAGLTTLFDHPGIDGCDCGCRPTIAAPDLWAAPAFLGD